MSRRADLYDEDGVDGPFERRIAEPIEATSYKRPAGAGAGAVTTVTITIPGDTGAPESYRIDASWLRGFCRAQGGLPALTHEEAARFWRDKRRVEQANKG